MTTPRRPQKPPPPARPTSNLPLGKKLLFSAVVLLAALTGLELAARLFARAVPDSRWSKHVALVDAVGFASLNRILVPDPDRFWTTKPLVSGEALSGRVASSAMLGFRVTTDERGCRFVPTVPAATHLVAFLGDSTTFGVGVDDGRTYAALLQQRLPGVQTVNLGVPGYTAYQGRKRLESFPFTTPPAALVVTFGFNDAASWDNVGDLQHAAQLDADRNRLVARSRFLRLLAGLLQRPAPEAAPGAPRRPRLLDTEFAGEIGSIVSWCREHGTRPILLVWPQRPQLAMDKVSPKQRVLLKIGAADPGVRVINLIEVFRVNGGESLFADMVHANAAGNQVIADALAPVVSEALGGVAR